ncbi:lipopolysaccharide assembly protein LapA domain-containing protein [Tunicatimonas pelagia]|uniref:lipopolysaccharide assembly protein LapA domain-containing protein n=1 Tax=Tunicatimonas pelagia TaxID=931531 RepID=UPI002665B007|nr:lipopolysaccharide assembly protein LapA domain-containing protein [Tunicatimonas pelagia]WKN41764.1 lipopolysaccharide assembly protein LapA domain-containing protein [Tunicatimonas pelagia]
MKRLIFVLLLLGLILTFILQNTSVTSVNFLFWYFESSRAVLLLLVFLAGLTVGTSFTLYLRRRKAMSSEGRGAGNQGVTTRDSNLVH